MPDVPNRHRRPDKIAKKYYFSPEVVALIEAEAARTGYSRNVVLEIVIRQTLGQETAPVVAKPRKPRTPKPEPVDLGI